MNESPRGSTEQHPVGGAERDEQLIEQALAARERAYAPYSGYPVGCALLAGGRLFTGANIENATYGLAICAERTAVVQAVLSGARDIELVAVATGSSPPASPCGLCRQTLFEFCRTPEKLRILMVNDRGERTETTLAELFPHGFRL